MHVPDHGDCFFDALVHVWNAEVGQNAPEAPWIVSARKRGLSQEAIQQAPAYQLLRDAMVDDMQAQLQKRTEEAATFTADEAATYRKQGVWGSEVCMLLRRGCFRRTSKLVLPGRSALIFIMSTVMPTRNPPNTH